MTDQTKVSDFFELQKDFEEFLSDACDLARGNWEEDFCQQLSERFDKWGMGMFLSNAQFEKLSAIVNR